MKDMMTVEKRSKYVCPHCIFNTSYDELDLVSVNCSQEISSCSFCNQSRECGGGGREVCKYIAERTLLVPDTYQGLCQDIGLIQGTIFSPDPLGKVISFGLLAVFLSVILTVCLR